MAYQMKVPGGWRNLFNIDSAVGFNGANRTDDVMLVQFLLRLWGSEHYGPPTPRRTERDGEPSGPVEARLPVRHLFKGIGPQFQSFLPAANGNCDGVTKTWIMMFQMFHKDTTGIIDGRVDPIAPSQLTTGNVNTMLLLNYLIYDQDYKGLPPGAPGALIQATQTVRS